MKVPLLLLALATTAQADVLAKLPTGYLGVGAFTGPTNPILMMLGKVPHAPACVAAQIARVTQSLMLQGRTNEETVNAFVGGFDRAAVEACFRETLTAMQAPRFDVAADGKLTVIRVDQAAVYLGWDDGLVFEGRRREAVLAALAHATHLTDDKPTMALVAKVDRRRPLWVAMPIDLTTKLLGVPSSGLLVDGDLAAKKVFFRLQYASPALAEKALAAIRKGSPKLSPALAEALAKTDFQRAGAQVSFDVMPLSARADLMAELTQLYQAALQK